VGVRGKGLLVPVSWGRGVWCAPSVHWCCACALSILLGEGVARTGLLGKGVLVPVSWGRGLMRPQRPLKLRMRSQHPFGGRGCSYRSVGGGCWCAPSVHWCCACALSILLGEGVLRCGGRNFI